MPSFASLGDEQLKQLAIFLEASKGPQVSAPTRARLPRDHRRLRALRTRRGSSNARRRRLRDRRLGLARRGSRCSRPSSTATRGSRRDETLAAPPRARRRRGHRLRPERLARAVRERLGAGRRLRDLPVLDGDARHDRRRGDDEPDPPGRVGRAQGGPQARPRAARDAALDDPPREHAHAAPGGRDDPVRSRRASTTAPRRSTTSSTSSSAAASTSSGSSNALMKRWGQE